MDWQEDGGNAMNSTHNSNPYLKQEAVINKTNGLPQKIRLQKDLQNLIYYSFFQFCIKHFLTALKVVTIPHI